MAPPKRPSRDALVALAVLLVGWAAAAVAYATAAPADDDPEVEEVRHGKRYERQVEMVGGKAAVFTSELNDRIAALWEGRSRAYTIAAMTSALAGGYLLVQRRAGRREEERP